MVILLTFRSFAREKKQESSQNFTIVLNLFAEIIVHPAFFTSVSMHQKMGIGSNNAFFKIPRHSIISLSMYFLHIPPFPPLDSHFMKRQQREISVKPSIKNEIKKSITVYRSEIEDTGYASSSFRQTACSGKRSRFALVLRNTVPPLSAPRRSSMHFPSPRRKRQNKKGAVK